MATRPISLAREITKTTRELKRVEYEFYNGERGKCCLRSKKANWLKSGWHLWDFFKDIN
jgi:hypothetical protein